MKHLYLLLSAILLPCHSFPSEKCHPAPGLDQLLRPGAILLLGELHGTVEGPGYLSRAVCTALASDLQVTVGLEIPAQEEASVERFLHSKGQSEDVSRLLSSPFWSREYQDGRTSQAMLDLLQSLRELSSSSPALEVILIDDPSVPRGRDKAMASNLASAAVAEPDRLILALTGNFHNRLVTRAAYEPMGFLLSRESFGERVVSLDMGHLGGSAWVCFGGQASDCGKQRMSGSAARSEGVELFANAGAYHGRYYVGEINASPPAKESLKQEP